jgi:hypothetical protein
MQEGLSAAWLTVDFFVHCYRISGRLDVRKRKLADQLNDRTTAFLQLKDVYVSNIDHPAHITAGHPTSVLRKQNVTAVIVAQQGDGLPREQSYGSYLGAYLRRVFVTIPFFEIQGDLRLSGRLDLRAVLATGTDRFVPILGGRMTSSAHSDIVFTGGAILVNRDQVGAFWVVEEE